MIGMSEITFLTIAVGVLVIVCIIMIRIVFNMVREIEPILFNLNRHTVMAKIIERREGIGGGWMVTWTCSECEGGVHRDDSFCKHCGRELVDE